jgi:hypothetical protein
VKDTTFIRRTPCECCDSLAAEDDTGSTYCKASPSGDCDCAWTAQVELLDEIAGQVAVQYKRIGDHEQRRELAEGTADGFANALYVQGQKAEFDCEKWLGTCGVARRAA